MQSHNNKFFAGLRRNTLITATIMATAYPLFGSASILDLGVEPEATTPSWSLDRFDSLEKDSDPATQSLQDALALVEKGKLKQAEVTLKKTTADHPGSASSFELYGSVLAMQGKLAEAEQAFQQGLKLNPNSAALITKLGTLKRATGDDKEAERLLLQAVKLSPKSRFAHQQLGLLYEKQKPLKAIRHFEKGLQGASDNYVGIRVNLARLYNTAGKFQDAQLQLDGRLNSKSSTEAYLVLGTAQYEQQKYPDALASFLAAQKVSSDPKAMLLPLGITYRDSGDVNNAKRSFLGYIEHKPEDHKGYYQLGRLYQQQKDSPNAKQMFEKALTLNPDSLASSIALAEVYIADKDQLSALEVLKQAKQRGLVHRDLFLGMANIYLLQDQRQLALDTIADFVKVSGESVSSLFIQGNYLAASGQYKEAVTSYKKVLQKQKNNKIALKALSITYQRQDLYDEAIDTARQLFDINPSRENKVFLATLLQSNGENDEAADIYRKVLASQADVVALNNLATIEMARGNYQSALKLTEQAAGISADNPNIQDSYGWALYHNGMLEKSEKVLKLAIELERQHEFLYHLGALYAKQGKNEEAAKMLRASLETSRSYDGKPEAEALLNALKL